MFGLSLTWRLATYGLTTIALGLSGALTLKTLEARRLETERDTLHDQIHNEETGYIVRLSTCRNNAATLEASIADQNERIAGLEAETADRLATGAATLTAIQDENADLRARLDDLLDRPVVGETVCERVEDVDRRIMEWLEQ